MEQVLTTTSFTGVDLTDGAENFFAGLSTLPLPGTTISPGFAQERVAAIYIDDLVVGKTYTVKVYGQVSATRHETLDQVTFTAATTSMHISLKFTMACAANMGNQISIQGESGAGDDNCNIGVYVWDTNGLDVNGRVDVGTVLGASPLTENDLTAATMATVVENSMTLKEILRIMLAVLAGKATGGGTTSVAFRDQADGKDRVAATVDSSGNRSAVTLDGTD